MNDGQIVDTGNNGKLGRYVVLQDAYGNQYTYSGLGEVSKFFPVPEDQIDPAKGDLRPCPPTTPSPTRPRRRARATARRSPRQAAADQGDEDSPSGDDSETSKERLFANPAVPSPARTAASSRS